MLADAHHRCGSPVDVQRNCLDQAGHSALTKLMRFRLKLWEHGPKGSTGPLGGLGGGRGRGDGNGGVSMSHCGGGDMTWCNEALQDLVCTADFDASLLECVLDMAEKSGSRALILSALQQLVRDPKCEWWGGGAMALAAAKTNTTQRRVATTVRLVDILVNDGAYGLVATDIKAGGSGGLSMVESKSASSKSSSLSVSSSSSSVSSSSSASTSTSATGAGTPASPHDAESTAVVEMLEIVVGQYFGRGTHAPSLERGQWGRLGSGGFGGGGGGGNHGDLEMKRGDAMGGDGDGDDVDGMQRHLRDLSFNLGLHAVTAPSVRARFFGASVDFAQCLLARRSGVDFGGDASSNTGGAGSVGGMGGMASGMAGGAPSLDSDEDTVALLSALAAHIESVHGIATSASSLSSPASYSSSTSLSSSSSPSSSSSVPSGASGKSICNDDLVTDALRRAQLGHRVIDILERTTAQHDGGTAGSRQQVQSRETHGGAVVAVKDAFASNGRSVLMEYRARLLLLEAALRVGTSRMWSGDDDDDDGGGDGRSSIGGGGGLDSGGLGGTHADADGTAVLSLLAKYKRAAADVAGGAFDVQALLSMAGDAGGRGMVRVARQVYVDVLEWALGRRPVVARNTAIEALVRLVDVTSMRDTETLHDLFRTACQLCADLGDGCGGGEAGKETSLTIAGPTMLSSSSPLDAAREVLSLHSWNCAIDVLNGSNDPARAASFLRLSHGIFPVRWQVEEGRMRETLARAIEAHPSLRSVLGPLGGGGDGGVEGGWGGGSSSSGGERGGGGGGGRRPPDVQQRPSSGPLPLLVWIFLCILCMQFAGAHGSAVSGDASKSSVAVVSNNTCTDDCSSSSTLYQSFKSVGMCAGATCVAGSARDRAACCVPQATAGATDETVHVHVLVALCSMAALIFFTPDDWFWRWCGRRNTVSIEITSVVTSMLVRIECMCIVRF